LPVGLNPNTLAQIVKDSGVKYKENSISYIFTCPRCSKKDKLYVRKNDGRFCCWVCRKVDGFEGRCEFALSALTNQSADDFRARLYGTTGIHVSLLLDVHIKDFFGDDDDLDVDAGETPVISWPFDYLTLDDPGAARGLAYLEGRGVPLDVALGYDIRYAPLRRRVAFPVASGGDLYGWQERTVLSDLSYEDEAGEVQTISKVMSSKKLPRDRELMFADRLIGFEHAVLCEGPLDAIKGHLCGGNVATMGKAVARGQMRRLLTSGVKRVYLALDPDAATETQRLVRDHYHDVELYNMVATGASDKPDLGAMTFAEVHALFLGAKRIGFGEMFIFMKPARTAPL
jgi:hypothetical protein